MERLTCDIGTLMRVDFHFSTVVWGKWHSGVFLDVNLPSLLAPDNLAAFAERHNVLYRIFTSANDVKRIKSTKAFEQASQIVQFEFIECAVENTTNPIGMHHELWRRSITDAEKAGAMVLFVPPDVIWANGCMRHVAELAAAGKRAIFMTYMRVVSETCVPAAMERYLSQDGAVLNASSRELVSLMMDHIHPLTLTYLRDSPNFPIHPEFILWSVPGEGFLMRVLVREMFAYDPALVDLNQQALPAHPIDPEILHYINDSDDLFALSLAPLTKDIEWYAEYRRYDPLKIGSWWLTYDSPANDSVALCPFYVHAGPRDEARWRRVEMESDVLIQGAIGTREVLRIIGALADDTYRYLRQVLSLALMSTHLSRMVRVAGPITLFLPTNDAMLRWMFEEGAALIDAPRGRKLVDLILDHVIFGPLPLAERKDAVLNTAGGRTRRLTWVGDEPAIDGVALLVPPKPLGRDWSYRSDVWGIAVGSVLPPARSVLPAVAVGGEECQPREEAEPETGAKSCT
jgi:hypothetical protein